MGSLLIDPKNANTGESDGENMVAIDSAIENKGTGKSNGVAKVGLEVHLNTATTARVFYQSITITDMLLSTSSISVSVCHQLAHICDRRSPLFQIQLPSCMSCAESMALSIKFFKNTQDISMYKEFLAADDLDDDKGGYYRLGL